MKIMPKKTEFNNSLRTLLQKITPIMFLFFIFCNITAQSIETANNGETNKTEDDSSATTSRISEDDDTISDFEEKKQTILYGLSSDILNLIKILKTDKDNRFDEDLQNIFRETKVHSIREALFMYFADKKDSCLSEDANYILENRIEYPKSLLNACIHYIKELKLSEANVFLHLILEDADEALCDACIAALGAIGNSEDAVFLTELFNVELFENEKRNLVTKQNIMSALEELHSNKTWDFLVDRANDEDENPIIRGSAASALGKIGDDKAIPLLANMFESEDPILRTAAVKGLAGFSDETAKAVLIQAFKDGYYKVRLQAVQSAKDGKNAEALPFILYKAKYDPENAVKFAAIEALPDFDNNEANTWLAETFDKEKTPDSIKLKIVEVLLKKNFSLIKDSVEKTVLKNINISAKKKFCGDLGKTISKIENQETEKIAEIYLNNSDAIFKSIGLDMFNRNKYENLTYLISEIANNEKNGALSRRAKKLLEKL